MRYYSLISDKLRSSSTRAVKDRLVFAAVLMCGAVFGGLLAFAGGQGVSGFAAPATPEKEDFFPRPAGESQGEPAHSSPITDTRLRFGDDGMINQSREPLDKSNSKGIEPGKPVIILFVDDLGLDPGVFEVVADLPGPLTLSFLPYASGVDTMAAAAKSDGHDVFLHLPMEPKNADNDPGPDALQTRNSPEVLRDKIRNALSSYSGYSGVNNHMGSRFTENGAAMSIVLSDLKRRDLLFVDSVTSQASKGARIAKQLDYPILSRDIFLDADHGKAGVNQVKARLAELEAIAREKGVAVAIAHPYPTTIEALKPWLVTLEARGFQLATVGDIIALPEKPKATAALR